ncbi:MAG TPA: hypothetical protein VII06_29460 [Chloroflexota bacterium]|jgi:hypothetical protein
MEQGAPWPLTRPQRAVVQPPYRAATDADQIRPARATAEPEPRDTETYLSVYFLVGTLLVFFLTGGFWIWHFAR